ncbi:MAG: hypothetical protein K2N48_12725 [Muribaculaceae bacterium]|nr:hypothetical protein [Muribaculaceae bacterium]
MKIRYHHILSVVFTIAYIITLSVEPVNARKIRTKHSIPKSSAPKAATDNSKLGKQVSIETDSIVFYSRILPAIRFYGFDKTVTSNIESFFISNTLDEGICGIEVDIIYTDMKGRQLHKRMVKIECDIPPGETKRYDIKSWDIQKSFYFHKSVKPKRQATPFDARIELRSVILN